MSNRPKIKPQVPVPKTGNVGIAQSFQQSFHHGPLPSPETLNGYETAFKGAAERIFIMAEKEQSGRLDIEKKIVNSEIIGEYVGQGFGFIIAMTGIIVPAIVVAQGYPWASTISIVSLAALVGKFLNRRKRENLPAGETQ